MLKGVFRILSSSSKIDVVFMPLVVAACCTLYNIIQGDYDIADFIDSNDSSQQPPLSQNNDLDAAATHPTANTIRDTIAHSIFEGELPPDT